MAKRAPKKKPKSKRKDAVVNDELISAKFSELLIKNQKMPSYAEIARELGLSEKTVQRHITGIDFNQRFAKFKAVSDKVITNLFKQAATGKNPQHIRLWLELIEGLGEKKKLEITEVKAPEIIAPGDEPTQD